MKDFTLKDISFKLIEVDDKLTTALTKLFPLEMEYQLRLDQLQLSSQRMNQFQREAESRSIIMREDIYVKYHEAKLEVKILYFSKDTLMEVSRNLRNLAFNNE